jgi:hypothetical protein
MTKLVWDRKQQTSILNSDYYTNPKTGFDKAWHDQQAQKKQRKDRLLNQEIKLGIHTDHDLDIIKLDSGPHACKLVCITCNNKFIQWLPKGII